MSRQRSLETNLAAEYVSISELVQLTGYRYSTLKYYTEEGLIPFEQAGERLTRRFQREKTLARIEQTQALKKQGLSIPEIKAHLNRPGS